MERLPKELWWRIFADVIINSHYQWEYSHYHWENYIKCVVSWPKTKCDNAHCRKTHYTLGEKTFWRWLNDTKDNKDFLGFWIDKLRKVCKKWDKLIGQMMMWGNTQHLYYVFKNSLF